MIEKSAELLDNISKIKLPKNLQEFYKRNDLPEKIENICHSDLPIHMESKGENRLPESIQNYIDELPKECKNTVSELPQTIETDNAEKTLEEKQDIADKAAQDYNAKTNPYERAIEKGIEGVQKTENGGVSFAETDSIYTKEDGTKCIVTIEATGKRTPDFEAANKAIGLEEIPEGYVWHHLDNYNVNEGTITLELVKDEVHNATKPHSGGCAQYDAVNGPSYNPPRKGEMISV